MPLRIAPTARQRRLGAELRKLREKAGLTSSAGAHRLGINQSRLSAIERGRYGVSEGRVRTFASRYDYHDEAHVAALVAMTAPARRRWWDEYREILPEGLLDLAELEHHARTIRSAQVTHLPGLLQTVDYARAVVRQSTPQPTPPQLEYLVSHRIKRQQILFSDEPTPYTATLHEAALRMPFGGRDVMRDQLTFLLEMSERARVTVRIVPFTTADFPGAGESAVYATAQVPALDTVLVEGELGVRQIFADEHLDQYRQLFHRLEESALSPAASRDHIHSIAKSL